MAGDSEPATSSPHLPDGECDARGTRIVVLGNDGVLRRFTPKQQTITAVAPIACPAPRNAGGVSFAVDHQGRGWISYATPPFDASATTDSVMLRVNVDDGTCDASAVAFASPAVGAWTFAIRGGVESLYALDYRGGLHRTDPATGTVTDLGALSDVGLVHENLFATAVAPAGDGQLFVLEDTLDNTHVPHVVTIDLGDAHIVEQSGVVFPHFDYGGGYVSSAPTPPLSMVRWDDKLWLFTVDASSKWDKFNAQFTVPTQSMVWLVDPVERTVVPFLRYLPFVVVGAATTLCPGSPVR